MSSVTYIYALVDPRDGCIRYIGKTACDLEKRLCEHISESHSNERLCYHKSRWIRRLVAVGLKPSIQLLEIVAPANDWADREKSWIAYGRLQGWRLTNLTDGGEGCDGRVLSESTRLKISLAQRGRVSPKRGKPLREDLRAALFKPCPEAFVSQLGAVPDKELSRAAGVSCPTVRRWREERGIPAFSFAKLHPMDRLQREYPDWVFEQLGKVSDRDIARKLGINPATIQNLRTRLGIPAKPKFEYPDWAIAFLGILSDYEIARELGCTSRSVLLQRQRLGIPPAGRSINRKGDST